MASIYNHTIEESEESNSPFFVQQLSNAGTVNDSDLTDNYIVNMMHDIGIEDNQPEYSPYPALKLRDQNSEVISMARELNADYHLKFNHGFASLQLVPEESNSAQPSNFPYATPNVLPSVEFYGDQEILNNPQRTAYDSRLTVPANTNCGSSSPEWSPPADYSEDSALEEHSIEYHHSICDLSSVISKRVAEEGQGLAKKKRGRKPKSEAEKAEALAKRRLNRNKVRVYQIDHPYEDKELERKRINAINSKKHRDQQKQQKFEMELQLAEATIGHDMLMIEIKELRGKLDAALKEIEAFQKYTGIQSALT